MFVPDLVIGGGAGGTNVKLGWKFSLTCWCNSAGSERVGITSRGEGVAEKFYICDEIAT